MSRAARIALVIPLAIVTLAGASGPRAQQLASLEGSWSGNGQVHLPSGNVESARCRASFHKHGGNGFRMNAVCATQSARVQQTAEVERVSASRFEGDFFNAEYNVSGSIVIHVRGSGLTASLRGGGGSAQFHLSR